MSIVEKYRRSLSAFITGKDRGIYYALNKELALATEDIVAILLPDDAYASSNVLAHVVATFERKTTD
jgi:hypothetical protein